MKKIGGAGEKINFKEQEKEITEIISNPFSQDKITGIHLHYSKVKSVVIADKRKKNNIKSS